MNKFILIISMAFTLYAQDLVELKGVALDMRYASNHNFVGEVVDGYSASKCYLHQDTVAALLQVEDALNAQNLHLVIYDCYRPQRAVDHFVRWAEDVNDTKTKKKYYPKVKKSELFEKGYIAAKSGHSRGNTVDLAIQEFDFGTPFDFFDERSHVAKKDIDKHAQSRRLYLKILMK